MEQGGWNIRYFHKDTTTSHHRRGLVVPEITSCEHCVNSAYCLLLSTNRARVEQGLIYHKGKCLLAWLSASLHTFGMSVDIRQGVTDKSKRDKKSLRGFWSHPIFFFWKEWLHLSLVVIGRILFAGTELSWKFFLRVLNSNQKVELVVSHDH